jgi:hypothetical protein
MSEVRGKVLERSENTGKEGRPQAQDHSVSGDLVITTFEDNIRDLLAARRYTKLYALVFS